MIGFQAEDIMSLFFFRRDVFAIQYDGGAYKPVYRSITIKDIQEHLLGNVTLGAYCIKDNMIRWACIDIDGKEDGSENEKLLENAEDIYRLFPDFLRMLEFSGRRGYHVWIFFDEPVTALYGKTLVKSRLNTVGMNKFEVFPKQVVLSQKGFGNLVKIPLAKHKVTGKFSKILKFEDKQKLF